MKMRCKEAREYPAETQNVWKKRDLSVCMFQPKNCAKNWFSLIEKSSHHHAQTAVITKRPVLLHRKPQPYPSVLLSTQRTARQITLKKRQRRQNDSER